jgi:hypothetical protein
MKITKAKLKRIIKEELEVILTNEEAGELFGEEIEKLLDEGFGEGTPPKGRVARPAKTKERKTKEAPLGQTQRVNLRAYIKADPKERNVISKLESALLAAAEHETLLSLPDVVRAIKLLQAALAKVSK